MASVDALLDTANAVHQARCTRLDPRPLQLFIAAIGQQWPLGLVGHEADREALQRIDVGNLPRLRGIRDIAVGQQHHRSHILHRNPHRLDRAVEGVFGRTRSDHRHRRIAVAAIDRLIEIGLFGLGRQAGRRTTALRVDDHQRQFGHDRQSHGLALQGDARTGRGCDAQTAGIAGTDRGGNRGDLGLEGGDAKFLEPRQMMQDRGSRCDRIAAEEHRQLRQTRACHQPQRQRFCARYGPIGARVCRSGRNLVMLQMTAAQPVAGNLGRFAIGMAGVECGDIRLGNIRQFGELAFQPLHYRFAVALEHPQRKAERPHILAAQRFLVAEAERLDRIQRQLRNIELEQLPFGQRPVFQGIALIMGLVEIALSELAFVGNHQTAGPNRLDIGFESRRIHRDQHIRLVTGGLDGTRSEIDLERGHAKKRALRRANFRGKIRESGKVIACQRRRERELPSSELHPVAAVAGETHDDIFGAFGAGVIRFFLLQRGGHD